MSPFCAMTRPHFSFQVSHHCLTTQYICDSIVASVHYRFLRRHAYLPHPLSSFQASLYLVWYPAIHISTYFFTLPFLAIPQQANHTTHKAVVFAVPGICCIHVIACSPQRYGKIFLCHYNHYSFATTINYIQKVPPNFVLSDTYSTL